MIHSWLRSQVRLLLAALILLGAARSEASYRLITDESPSIAFDGSLWDSSNDGRPYRLSLLQPATPDPLGRLFRVTDQQWTASLGYAVVKEKIARGDGRLIASGGESLMFGVGRQWRWALPAATQVRDWRAHLSIELGINYADDSLPSDGTHVNFPVVPGIDWSKAYADGTRWSFGVRWFHLSNANLLPGNSGYDGLVFRISRSFDWR